MLFCPASQTGCQKPLPTTRAPMLASPDSGDGCAGCASFPLQSQADRSAVQQRSGNQTTMGPHPLLLPVRKGPHAVGPACTTFPTLPTDWLLPLPFRHSGNLDAPTNLQEVPAPARASTDGCLRWERTEQTTGTHVVAASQVTDSKYAAEQCHRIQTCHATAVPEYPAHSRLLTYA